MTSKHLTIDLNVDMGEHPPLIDQDRGLLVYASSINLACAAHAGDELTTRTLVRHALHHGCAIGAHPAYPDRGHFGRRRLNLAPAQLEHSIRAQIAWLDRIVSSEGGALRHVKPHGALYHAANTDTAIARAIGSATLSIDSTLRLIGAAGSMAHSVWRNMGLETIAEGFADRAYEPDGSLRARELDGAMICAPSQAAEQAVLIACDHSVIAYDGTRCSLACDTLCIHSDTPNALAIAQAIHTGLSARRVRVRPYQTM